MTYNRVFRKEKFPGIIGKHGLFYGHQFAPLNHICLGLAALNSFHSLQGWHGYDKTEEPKQRSEITRLNCTCSDPFCPPWSFGYLANASLKPHLCLQIFAVSQAESDFPWMGSQRGVLWRRLLSEHVSWTLTELN